MSSQREGFNRACRQLFGVCQRILSTIRCLTGLSIPISRNSVGPRGVLMNRRSLIGLASFNDSTLPSRVCIHSERGNNAILCSTPRFSGISDQGNDLRRLLLKSVCDLKMLLCRLLANGLPRSAPTRIRHRTPFEQPARVGGFVRSSLRRIILAYLRGRPAGECRSMSLLIRTFSDTIRGRLGSMAVGAVCRGGPRRS